MDGGYIRNMNDPEGVKRMLLAIYNKVSELLESEE